MARLLVIEDEPGILLVLAEFLQKEGFVVDTAADGPSGLKKLRQLPKPDMVLLDFILPGMTGGDIMKFMRADPELAHVPVVLITGSNPSVQDFPAADTYQALINKPFDLNHLLDTIKTLLKYPKTKRESAGR